MLNRRDSRNPEGGGSEIYLERVAAGLVARGHTVTVFCSAYEQSIPNDVVDGVEFVRRGSKLGVHREAVREIRAQVRNGVDIIVDVQNGIPFFSRLAAPRTPSVVLVHHLHREQWPVVYEPTRAKIGWFIESQVSPRLYRDRQYVAVSEHTRDELVSLGVNRSRIDVVPNGVDKPTSPLPHPRTLGRPTITVLGRLVPHKQVEHALLAAQSLRQELPDLHVDVIGDGWWADRLYSFARAHGIEDITTFHGFVESSRKHQLLAQSTVLAMPSLKEGWGQVIMEAATFGVPAVGYLSAGGVADSIRDGETGLLVGASQAKFTEALRTLLTQEETRTNFGRAARLRCDQFGWDDSITGFEDVLAKVLGQRTRKIDLTEDTTLRIPAETEVNR
jgi:glycosyltransferase involved in cell wall biosynthesis